MNLWNLEISLHKCFSWWRFLHRISVRPMDPDVLVCLIPSTYLGMHCPTLGPVVLHWGKDVMNNRISICQGLTQKFGLWYMSIIRPYAGYVNVTASLIGQASGVLQESWMFLGNKSQHALQCLRLLTHVLIHPLQCQTYIRCLTTFICCGCAYGCVLIIIPPLSLTKFWYGASLGGTLCNTSKA